MTFNVAAYAHRLYTRGHEPADFAELAPGIIIVSPVRPTELSVLGPDGRPGIELPGGVRDIKGQFCLSHRVEVVGPNDDYGLGCEVGDIVKVYEAHLDPLDPKGDLLSIPQRFVKAVITRAKPEG